ncbi:MAG: class I SAM-dependent methyltransferase [Pseudomonadota bacterium]
MPFPHANTPSRLPQLYDAASTSWQDTIDRLGYPGAYAELAAAAFATDLSSRPKILDVGTGTGALAAAIIRRSGPPQSLDLLDVSENMLEIAGRALRAHGPRLIHGAVGAVDLPERAYDVILCAHTIEHLPDPERAMSWMRRHLKPDGRIVLSISKPHWCTALIRWRWGHKAYRKTEVESLLATAGLTHLATVEFSKGPPRRTSQGYIATV